MVPGIFLCLVPGSVWTTVGDLDLGVSGAAQMIVADGGHVRSSVVRVGMLGPDTCTVTGSDSIWEVENLYLGIQGEGSL